MHVTKAPGTATCRDNLTPLLQASPDMEANHNGDANVDSEEDARGQGAGVNGSDTVNGAMDHATSHVEEGEAVADGQIADLFCALAPPLLQPSASRRPRQRRTFDMTKVRIRSARLANRPSMPAMERAQCNL